MLQFNDVIANNLVRFKFQPIVNLRNGSVFAYEALMRPEAPLFDTPLKILDYAKLHNRMYQIEKLTWFNALAAFRNQRELFGDSLLFLNSIPNQMLLQEDWLKITQDYADLMERLVVEFTENEKTRSDSAFIKKQLYRSVGARIALDDYGEGFSDDNFLHKLNPHFVKVDMYLVQNVDRDNKKRGMLRALIALCKNLRIRVICEGVEREDELAAVIEAGADYVQGYFLAKPEFVPQRLISDKAELVRKLFSTLVLHR